MKKPGGGVQLAECLPPDMKAWVRVQTFHKPGMEAHGYNPRALGGEGRRVKKFKVMLCSIESLRSAGATRDLVCLFGWLF